MWGIDWDDPDLPRDLLIALTVWHDAFNDNSLVDESKEDVFCAHHLMAEELGFLPGESQGSQAVSIKLIRHPPIVSRVWTLGPGWLTRRGIPPLRQLLGSCSRVRYGHPTGIDGG